MDNRTLLQKADLALADLVANGGYLKPTQSLRFIRLLAKQSALLGMCTLVPMRAPKEERNKIALSQRVLRPAREATPVATADRVKPETSKVELDTKMFKGQIDLSDEVLEDNIESGELRQTVMEMMSAAIARDMEELAVRGDTTSPDPYLAQLDGVLKQVQSHVVDAAGAGLGPDILTDLMKTMPAQYQRDTSTLRFLTAKNPELDYRRGLQQRETVAGDQMIQEDIPVRYSGVPIVPIPLWPDQLGPQSSQTTVAYLDPKNIAIGVWRQVRVETVRDITEGVLKIVATVRFDVKLVDELGTAKAINVAAA
jgi:HK97 family phage major capsid protein